MSILILNAVSHDRCPYEKYLKHLNEDLILLTAEEYKSGFHSEDYVHIEAFSNYDDSGYVDLRAIQLYEKYPYHTIISCYEFDVLRAAKIREKLNLQGQKSPSALMYRNKLLMKQTIQKHNIPVPAFAQIDTPIQLIEFIENYGYPVIIKPIQGAGSMETDVIQNEQKLIQFLIQGLPEQMMAESFVNGSVYHVDGMIINGEIQFICTSKYLNSLITYKNGHYTGGYLIHPANPLSKRMSQLTKQVVDALDTPKNTTFHAEWFHTPDDDIIFCEIACRAGGGRINETIIETFGVDLFKAHVDAQIGNSILFPTQKEMEEVDEIAGRVLILKKEATLITPPASDPPEWVVQHELKAQAGVQFSAPRHCVDYVANFIVKGKTENEVSEKLIFITDWFEQNAHWE